MFLAEASLKIYLDEGIIPTHYPFAWELFTRVNVSSGHKQPTVFIRNAFKFRRLKHV
jgi:hypothetical protein